jgi:DNA-binding IclR family transcriptional regulator
MNEKYKAPIVKKAFQILRLISKNEQGMKISELSTSLGISKSTVHGITASLEELGAIIRDPLTKHYTLGFTLFELGRAAYARIDVKDLARPFMEELMTKTQESVFLGVRNVNHVTILDIVESMNELKITSPIGMTMPLLAGAIGKIFLAYMAETQAAELLQTRGLHRYTQNSITDPQVYTDQLRFSKKHGYATDDEEYISGVRAVAAPIKTDGQLLAAIWVVGLCRPSSGRPRRPLRGSVVRLRDGRCLVCSDRLSVISNQ